MPEEAGSFTRPVEGAAKRRQKPPHNFLYGNRMNDTIPAGSLQ
jgi:hypothetical protein